MSSTTSNIAVIRPGDTCRRCEGDAEELVDGEPLCDEHAQLARASCVRCDDGTPAVRHLDGEPLCSRHAGALEAADAQVVWARDHVHMAPDGERYSDIGNANRLIARHGDEVRFIPTWKRWLTYDGGRWRIDHADTIVAHLAANLGRELLDHVGEVYHDADAMKALRRWVVRCESVSGFTATLRAAETRPGVAIDHEALDADGWLLNVANGTVDLRTMELRPHRPGDLLRMQAAVEFDPGATAPQWSTFLETVLPDAAVREFVRRLLGLALVGEQIEHVLPICLGGGANGKSTLTKVVASVLGEYGVVAARDVLLALKHDTHPTAKASLFRRRFAHSGELPAGARLDEAQVKELTGGDRITARRMREDPWEFYPSHLLWLHANHRPHIEGTDDGIWRRVLLIPFDVQVPEPDRDPYLAERLVEAESPGILNWMLAGLADYRENGLRVPDAVRAATTAYRHDSDTVAAFIDESSLEFGAGCEMATNELLALHGEWFAATGSTEPEKAHYQRVVAELKDRGAVQGRTKSRGRFWRGVGLPDDGGDNG